MSGRADSGQESRAGPLIASRSFATRGGLSLPLKRLFGGQWPSSRGHIAIQDADVAREFPSHAHPSTATLLELY